MLQVSSLGKCQTSDRPTCVADKVTVDEYESSILFAAQIRRLFPFYGSSERSWGLRGRSAVLWNWIVALAALNYTSSPTPTRVTRYPSIFTLSKSLDSSGCKSKDARMKGEEEKEESAPRRAFRIKTFVSTELPLAAISFITLSRWHRTYLSSVYALLTHVSSFVPKLPSENRNGSMCPWVSPRFALCQYKWLCRFILATSYFQLHLPRRHTCLKDFFKTL